LQRHRLILGEQFVALFGDVAQSREQFFAFSLFLRELVGGHPN
jgi:hypothetical protein